MPLIQDWMPPTRPNYDTLLLGWQLAYPVVRPSPLTLSSSPSSSLLTTANSLLLLV